MTDYPFHKVSSWVKFGKEDDPLIEISNTRGWRRIFFWRKRVFKRSSELIQEACQKYEQRRALDIEKPLFPLGDW